MANGKIRFGKQSGGQLALVIPDGLDNTEVIVPESGILATEQYVDGKYSGFKNYIINGNFDIWQRGLSQTISGYGSDDRWHNGNNVSTKTHSQIACTDTERVLFNASKFSRTVVSSVVGAGNFVGKRTSIEDVTKLAGKTITVSFWAKADSNKNIWLEFIQSFGTGGSPSTPIDSIYGQAIALTSTWQKKTITLTLPSIVGKTLGTAGVHTSSTSLQFWFDVGSDNIARIPTGIQQSGTFDIAQVQLEEGSVATPFENRPFGLELSLCQRYYEKSFNVSTEPSNGSNTTSFSTQEGSFTYTSMNGALFGGHNSFKVEKRAIPTMTKYGNSNGHWCFIEAANTSLRYFDASLGFTSIGTSGFSAGQQVRDSLFIMCQGHWTASAEL